MGYTVIDKKGVAYLDESNNFCKIPEGGKINDSDITKKGYFTKGGIENMLKNKRIVSDGQSKIETPKEDESKEDIDIDTPANKKDEIKDKKGRK